MSLPMNSRQVNSYENIKPSENGKTPDVIVDMRSDTLTKPDEGMRQAMFKATVGDDVFKEDITIQELESRVAKILGKEAGLFVSSGTMGNLLAALVHCDSRGSELIVGSQAHMFFYEQGNISQFGGIHSNQIPNLPDGTFSIEDAMRRIRSNDVHYPITKLICVENTHNRCGGRVIPLEWIDQLGKISKEHGIPLHMDGARIFNASIALGIPASRIVRDFASVSVCLSKGLGAPIGSVVVGDIGFIEKARRLRKALGGGMRQVGILGAAGLYCLDKRINRLQDDHDNTKILATIVNAMNSPHVFVNSDVLDSNIVMLNINGFPVPDFCRRLATVTEDEIDHLGSLISVKCLPWSDTVTRLVLHVDITKDMAIRGANKICYVAKEFLQNCNGK